MARYIHKVQIGLAYELHFRGVEQAIVIFTDEPCVLDGFLGKVADIGLCADDAHVVFLLGSRVQGHVLANEHSDAYA